MARLEDQLQYSDHVVTVLNGAVTAQLMHHPDRSFVFDISMDLEKGKAHFGRKPPTHFHFQEEYIQVTEGILAVEVEGKEMRLTAADGVFTVRPYVNHRLYPTPISSQDSGHVIRFLLSGQKMPQPYNMDVIFFENWYKYQDHVVVDGAPISLIQVLSIFDGGGTYLSLPSWLPFGQTISMATGIVVGRWMGGLLGYQPFYRQWTTDWQLACEKMQTSFFHRRFAENSKIE